MTKEQLIALGLSEEQATAVAAASADELENYISKADHTQLEGTKITLENQLSTLEALIKDLAKDTKGSTTEDIIKNFQQSYDIEKGNYQKEIETLKFNHALEKALSASQARNPTTVKALLKLENIKVNDDGSITGLDEQIKAIKESDAFLFAEEHIGTTGSRGNFPSYIPKLESIGIGERLGKEVAAKEIPANNPYFK